MKPEINPLEINDKGAALKASAQPAPHQNSN